jgi:hypothetical protein
MENDILPKSSSAPPATTDADVQEAFALVDAADADIKPWTRLVLLTLISLQPTRASPASNTLFDAAALPSIVRTAIAEFGKLRSIPEGCRRNAFLDALCAAHPELSECREGLIPEGTVPLVTTLLPLFPDGEME